MLFNFLVVLVGFLVVLFMDIGNLKGGEYKYDEVGLGYL